MAGLLLYFIVFFGFVVSIIMEIIGKDPGMFIRVVIIGSLWVLAFCEAISRRSEND